MATRKLARKARHTRAVEPERLLEEQPLLQEEGRMSMAEPKREPARSGRRGKSRLSVPVIQPIEDHVPVYWKHRALRIEPLFDQTLIDTPAQLSAAQVARAVEEGTQSAGPGVGEGIPSPIQPPGMPEVKGVEEDSGRQAAQTIDTPAQMLQTPVSADVMSPARLAQQRLLEQMHQPVSIEATAAHVLEEHRTLLKATPAQQIIERLRLWVRRTLAALSHLRGPALTPSGMRTLSQLKRLFALVSAGFGADDMEMVRLKVAFGEAYYHVMEASRRRQGRRRRDEPAEYQAYIERFLAAEHAL